MSSFKLTKYDSEKSAAKSLGVFVAIMGIVVFFLFGTGWAVLMVLIGLVLALAGSAADE